MSYLTNQLRFTKLSPYFWRYHCAICTCVYLQFYFAIINWDLFPRRTHAKDLFFSIKHSHLRCWRCLMWRIIFSFAKVILFIVLNWIWLRFASTLFWEVSHFFTGYGLPPHLVHILLLLLAEIFSFDFRKVFLKLNPTSSFTVKGFLPDEELVIAIAWLLNCNLLVNSVINIVGFALLPSSSLSFASGSLKPEINFIFTNSFSGLAAVLSFSKSQ